MMSVMINQKSLIEMLFEDAQLNTWPQAKACDCLNRALDCYVPCILQFACTVLWTRTVQFP